MDGCEGGMLAFRKADIQMQEVCGAKRTSERGTLTSASAFKALRFFLPERYLTVCSFEDMIVTDRSSGQAQWLSWLERRPVTAEVVGSNPIWVVYMGS